MASIKSHVAFHTERKVARGRANLGVSLYKSFRTQIQTFKGLFQTKPFYVSMKTKLVKFKAIAKIPLKCYRVQGYSLDQKWYLKQSLGGSGQLILS